MSREKNISSSKVNLGKTQSSEAYNSSFDQKEKSFEELFDSGYSSNLLSKNFLDLDSEFDSKSSSKISSQLTKKPKNEMKDEKQQQHQWSDSGVCITDSGLSINEDETLDQNINDEPQNTQSQEHISHDNDSIKLFLKKNSEGDTLLHLAIIEGLEEISCSIIQNVSFSNEMLNSYNYLYQTPLHLAVLKRQKTVIQHLLQKGASWIFQDNLGNTPLHIACKYSLVDIVELFVYNSLPRKLHLTNCFNIKNFDGDTCLHLAFYNSDFETLELLIKAGANIDSQEGKSGKTVLHCAVENLHVQMVYFLLFKCKANIQARTFAEKTPFHYIYKTNKSLKENSNGSTAKTNLLKSQVNKIVKLMLEYCNEQKLIIEATDIFSQNYESDLDSLSSSSSSDNGK